MNEPHADDRDFTTEARIEWLAETYVRANGLMAVSDYRWCEDERREFIADCVAYARNQLDGDEQVEQFRDCLNELLPPSVDRAVRRSA